MQLVGYIQEGDWTAYTRAPKTDFSTMDIDFVSECLPWDVQQFRRIVKANNQQCIPRVEANGSMQTF